MSEKNSHSHHDISVRSLAEFVFRRGDLFSQSGFVGPGRAMEGVRGHQRLQASRPPQYRSEVPLKWEEASQSLTLCVRGRIDGVMETPEGILLEEIKTTHKASIQEPSWLHLCQIRLYGALWIRKGETRPLLLQLTYYHLESGREQSFNVSEKTDVLEAFLMEAIDTYTQWLHLHEERCRQRDASLRSLEFPFPSMRHGQSEMIQKIEALQDHGGAMMVEAPTGIGKTMATLLPTLKALPHGKIAQCLIVSARGPGQRAFEGALQRLRDRGGKLRSITLTAQEKTCLLQGQSCDPNRCTRRVGYFDRLHSARIHALEKSIQHLSTEALQKLANEHDLCPHALGLDLAPWMDVLIGDYHYAFHPAASLDFIYGEEAPRMSPLALLVDEAHNLAERGREIHSQQLDTRSWVGPLEIIKKKDPQAAECLRALWRCWMETLRPRAEFREKSIPTVPSYQGDLFEHDFPAETQVQDPSHPLVGRQIDADQLLLNHFPEAWQLWMRRFLDRSETILSQDATFDGAASWVQLYFEMHGCLKQLLVDSEEHCLILKKEGDHIRFHRYCIDPSKALARSWGRSWSTLFFSATLHPQNYHRRLLGLSDAARSLSLPSPFSPDQWRVWIHTGIETTYRRRAANHSKVVEAIHATLQSRQGHYLVFFPSYDYLDAIAECWQKAYPDAEGLLIRQKPEMSLKEREAFLAEFSHPDEKTKLGFALLGGIFGEGIDLVGAQLIGVMVVGVGLPQICLERDLIRDHFEHTEGCGFDFAYTFPGLNRVLQGVGRLIRSPSDQGIVLLMDARYDQPSYRGYLPASWPVDWIQSTDQIPGKLEAFWSDRSPTA